MALSNQEAFDFMSRDFTTLWRSTALNPFASGRGNFTFALLGMILLEWTSRVAQNDPLGAASLIRFEQELRNREQRYFATLPGLRGGPQKLDHSLSEKSALLPTQ